MDPRHTLYRTFEKLAVDPEQEMSARTDQEAAQVQATSGVTPESIEKKLRESLGAVYVEIADLSGMLHVVMFCCICLLMHSTTKCHCVPLLVVKFLFLPFLSS